MICVDPDFCSFLGGVCVGVGVDVPVCEVSGKVLLMECLIMNLGFTLLTLEEEAWDFFHHLDSLLLGSMPSFVVLTVDDDDDDDGKG